MMQSYRNIDITIDGMCVLIRLILCSVQSVQARISQSTHGVRVAFSEARRYLIERQAGQCKMPEYLFYININNRIYIYTQKSF